METEQISLEKPFTDKKENYTVINAEEPNCFKIINLDNGHEHVVNPFLKTCDCEDFKFRTNGGSCKHINFLRTTNKMQPLLQKYNKLNSGPNNPNQSTELIDIQPYHIFERKDEAQILSEMQGNVIEEFVYSFKQGGRDITGLSYAGVKQLALLRGNIHCSEPILQEYNNSWLCKVKAVDVVRNLEVWGVATQTKMMSLRDGNRIKDDFCIQKAVSKAERNALRKLMPEKIIVEMVKEWKKGNGGNKE